MNQTKQSSTQSLTQTTITFGKYKDQDVSILLRDRGYCQWVLEQEWFRSSYEFLFNVVQNYDPRNYFLPPSPPSQKVENNNVEKVKKEEKKKDVEDKAAEIYSFLDTYPYFHLNPLADLALPYDLTDDEKVCYTFYLTVLEDIKQRIYERIDTSNPYNIKMPMGWLKQFERKTGLERDMFKSFLSSHALPNIPSIIEEIKKVGGLSHLSAHAFTIAKKNSVKQEQFWEKILRERYGEDIGVQFKYENCIFDFIHIPSNTIFEAKLSLKDFNEEQHRKYLLTLSKYRIIYLIGYDTVVNIPHQIIYTLSPDKYLTYQLRIPYVNSSTDFDYLIETFDVIGIENLEDVM